MSVRRWAGKITIDDGWRLALTLLLTLRVALESTGALGLRLQPVTGVGGDWLNLVIRGGQPWSQLLSMWQRWDALWYQQIAEHGYHAADNTIAFYPLYPLLARAVSVPLGNHVVWAELVVSSVMFAVAMWLLYKVARLDVDCTPATLAVLLTALFPVGFFLLAPYTESLFLALSLGAFWYARRRRPWLAGLVGLAASLTRAQGVLLALPLAFESIAERRRLGKHPGLDLIAAALPVVGFFAVDAYDVLAVRAPRVGLAVLAAWGYQVVPPWAALRASFLHITSRGDPIEALNLICLLGFGVLALLVGARLPFSYVLYVWPSLAVLATREAAFSPLISVSRYTLVLFPCFVVLATLLARRPWLAMGWLLTSVFLQATLWQYWIHFGFVA